MRTFPCETCGTHTAYEHTEDECDIILAVEYTGDGVTCPTCGCEAAETTDGHCVCGYV